MQISVSHLTQYCYQQPLLHSCQYLHLQPSQSQRQHICHWQIDAPGTLTDTTDSLGNALTVLSCHLPQTELCIDVSGEVITDHSPYSPADKTPLAYFLRLTPLTRCSEAISNWLGPSLQAPLNASTLLQTAAKLHHAMRFEVGHTDINTTAEQAFALGVGVCQDFSHVLIGALRQHKIPARYVSGYLYTPYFEHTASHAWVEVWLPEQQAWLGVDVANQCLMGEQHIRLAAGLDFLDVAPVRGVRLGGGQETLQSLAIVKACTQ